MDCPYETEWRRAYTPLTAMEEASRCLLCEDAPCSADCPAGTDPGRFIRSIRFLNDEGAAATILSNNALGDVCARVCPTERYCERRCTRAEVDRPIDIKGLQRFATDFAAALSMEVLEAGPDTGRSVAVVGAGPGALQAAATLRRMGHAVDVYERDTVAGGMLAHGIPAYRLPDDVVAAAVSRIERLGAKVHTGVRVGAGCAVTCQGLLVGLATPNILPAEDLDRDYRVYPEVDQDACVGCGRCYVSCYDGAHQAIVWDGAGRRVSVDEERCVGCHLCRLVCPVHAIHFGRVAMKEGRDGDPAAVVCRPEDVPFDLT